MTSTSVAGKGTITMTFTLATDADRPVVARSDPDAQPIVYITFDSDLMSQTAITEYLNQFLANGFLSIIGVAQVILFGGRDYPMSIRLMPEELAAHGLTVNAVVLALESHDVDIPAGSITVGPNRYSLRTATVPTTAEEFHALVVGGGRGHLAPVG
ncbi:MAG: efflux RND transporter permease subunit [Rhodospirillum sp.]|nr:efflux RND transporter permease subunit [Rhodospirillum sp.]MCF8491106.1 efflux RND transporter permease subunit [Rhodospirillum sp.]MCF8502796.1 efflux RND transporter permease subunit [Rhodospirillum sp.]